MMGCSGVLWDMFGWVGSSTCLLELLAISRSDQLAKQIPKFSGADPKPNLSSMRPSTAFKLEVGLRRGSDDITIQPTEEWLLQGWRGQERK
jgi:hypothetical protein